MKKEKAQPAMSDLIPMHTVAFSIAVLVLELAVYVTGI